MSLVIDLLIIASAIAAIYLGIQRGFVKSIMNFASIILALIAVFVFTAPVKEWLFDNYVEEHISTITESSLNGIVDAGVDRLKLEKVLEDRPDALIDVTERFSVNIDELVSYYSEFLTELAESIAIDKLALKLAAPTADALSTVLASVIVFVAALAVLKLITWILDLVCRLPVLNKLNKFLGFLFGAASAALLSVVISNVAVGLITALESVNSDIFNKGVIEGSVILRFLYDSSLIFFG